jgi:hypothetical protein
MQALLVTLETTNTPDFPEDSRNQLALALREWVDVGMAISNLAGLLVVSKEGSCFDAITCSTKTDIAELYEGYLAVIGSSPPPLPAAHFPRPKANPAAIDPYIMAPTKHRCLRVIVHTTKGLRVLDMRLFELLDPAFSFDAINEELALFPSSKSPRGLSAAAGDRVYHLLKRAAFILALHSNDTDVLITQADTFKTLLTLCPRSKIRPPMPPT